MIGVSTARKLNLNDAEPDVRERSGAAIKGDATTSLVITKVSKKFRIE
jgi:hypothetical protein